MIDPEDNDFAEYWSTNDDIPESDSLVEEDTSFRYGSVDEFVREYLRHIYRRRIDGRNRCWAGEWWRYDEAVIRLDALWRAWEHLRLDPATGMSVWLRDHADYHMPILMSPEGPFADATAGAENMCKRGEPLPYVAPPEDMFPDLRQPSSPS